MPREHIPLAEVYGLLEPGPVILLATRFELRANIMTLSWHTMLEFEPPLLGCVLSEHDYSYVALRETKECTLNIPSAELSAAVVGCGNTSGRDTDKFARFGLTPLPAAHVRAPLIQECFANLECRIIDTTLVSRYGFFVLEVMAAWRDPARKDHPTLHHRGNGRFMLAGETIQLPSHMR